MGLRNVSLGENPPHLINVVVECPKGSTNKYEYDLDSGTIKLDRVLFSPLYYPFDYGYIPDTLYIDGDPLDALVVLSHPTFPGCIVEAKPIGVLEMSDEKGRDEKLLCVAARDPRFSHWENLSHLSRHRQKEIIHFFEVYKVLEEKSVEVKGWHDVDVAKNLIEQFRMDKPRANTQF